MWFGIKWFRWASRNKTLKELTEHTTQPIRLDLFDLILFYILFYGFIYGRTYAIRYTPYTFKYLTQQYQSYDFKTFWHISLNFVWFLCFAFCVLGLLQIFGRNRVELHIQNWFNWMFCLVLQINWCTNGFYILFISI